MRSSRLVGAVAGFTLGCAVGIGITFVVYDPEAIGWLQRLGCGLFVGLVGGALGAVFRVRA